MSANKGTVYNATHETVDLMRQIINGISVKTGDWFVSLFYTRKTASGRKIATYEAGCIRQPPAPNGSTQWMVRIEGDDVTLASDIHGAVENAINELVWRVMKAEWADHCPAEEACLENTEEWSEYRERRP